MSISSTVQKTAPKEQLVAHVFRGIVAMVLGVFFFTIQDLIIKMISGGYPVHEIVFVRSFAAILIIGVIARFDQGFAGLKTSRLGLHIARSIVMFGAYTLYYLGLASLSLADTTVISYAAPFFIATLALVFLGERVSTAQWGAIAVGFLGVLIVMRPGSGLFNAAALLPLAAAMLYAVAQMLARYIGRTDTGSSLAFYLTVAFVVLSGLCGIVFQLLPLPVLGNPSFDFLVRPWAWPTNYDLALMLICGLVASLGIYCLSQAYRLAPAALVSSFEYSSIPWVILWGVLFFGQWPTLATIGGVILVVSSGLFMLWKAD
jgi:drug/metabolite transporter (DMT)-like permease